MFDPAKAVWSKELASPMRGIEIDGCKFGDGVRTTVSLKNATQSMVK